MPNESKLSCIRCCVQSNNNIWLKKIWWEEVYWSLQNDLFKSVMPPIRPHSRIKGSKAIVYYFPQNALCKKENTNLWFTLATISSIKEPRLCQNVDTWTNFISYNSRDWRHFYVNFLKPLYCNFSQLFSYYWRLSSTLLVWQKNTPVFLLLFICCHHNTFEQRRIFIYNI